MFTRDAESTSSIYIPGELREAEMREMEEARLRIDQLQRAVKWWSESTCKWSEKWAKVITGFKLKNGNCPRFLCILKS